MSVNDNVAYLNEIWSSLRVQIYNDKSITLYVALNNLKYPVCTY